MRTLACISIALVACMAGQANASFFDIWAEISFSSVSHTKITFETDGAGNALNVPEGSWQDLYNDEYNSQGILFDQDIYWCNDSGDNFEAAQAIGGSPEISIPRTSTSMTDLIITFSVPVKSVGLWVIDRNDKPNVPSLEARTPSGQVIGTVTFQGDFVDGSVGNQNYGFLGLASTDTIGSIRLSYDYTGFDNLNFSPEMVPEPGCLALLAVGTMALLRKRRR